jgi:hypothetical protein
MVTQYVLFEIGSKLLYVDKRRASDELKGFGFSEYRFVLL